MSDSENIELRESSTSNRVLPFPISSKEDVVAPVATPKTDALILEAEKLDKLSNYKCQFDYEAYRNIERRYADNPIRGGITMGNAFRLVNSHSTCQQCLYAFEIDTYGRGCVHNCAYCYAKAQLTVHGYWNNPIPVPVDLNEIRKAFYVTFETDKKHKYRDILQRRIPLRIGSMSDSFMWMDQKIKITQELLKILNYYQYPYVVFTRSDLIAKDEYIDLLNPDLGAVQFSIASTNDKMNKLIEPGSPSAKRRLIALQKLNAAGIWTTVRINPLFPIYPDGYFTDPNFKWDGEVPKFDYSSFDMIDDLAAYKVPSVLAGFGRFSRLSLNAVERATNFNLRQLYRRDSVNKSERDFHFSDKEIRYYYQQLKSNCDKHGIQFTTCYIGNGEGHFWKDQDLWSNKRDCCSIKGKVKAFKTDSREIPFDQRLKHTNHKDAVPVSQDLHKSLEPLSIVPKQSTLDSSAILDL
jgi:DNA repair photolyase